MKTTPNVNLCNPARSVKSLHPVSVLVKKKKNRNARPKKVRFNMQVQFSSSEEMLYPRCVEFCKQDAFGLENDYELGSQSNLAAAGCSRFAFPNKSARSFAYLINPSQYQCQTPYSCWNFDSVRSAATASSRKQHFLHSLLRHGLLRKVHTGSGKDIDVFQNCKNNLQGRQNSLTPFNQPWPSNNFISIAPKRTCSECCTSEISYSNGADIHFNWTQPLQMLRSLQSNATSGQANTPQNKRFDDLTDCIAELRIASHSAREPVKSEMDLTVTNTTSSQTNNSSARKGELVYDLSKNTSTIESADSLGSFVELDKSEEEQNVWPGMPCYDMNNNAVEKSDNCPKSIRDSNCKNEERAHSSSCMEAETQKASDSLVTNILDTIGGLQCSERKKKINNMEATRPGCSCMTESSVRNSSNSNSSCLHSNSSPNFNVHPCTDSLISQAQDLLPKSEKNISGQSAAISQSSNNHKVPVSELNDEINLCYPCPRPKEMKQMATIKENSIFGSEKIAIDFFSDSREVSNLSILETQGESQESISQSNVILYQCSILNCGMHFTDQQLLQEHLAQIHHSSCNPMATIVNGIVPNITKFLCPLCGHIFQDVNTCLEHMLEQNHSRLMSPIPFCVFACPQCLCYFSTFSLTLQHMNDLSHHTTVFAFDEDTKHNNEAAPIPVPYRLMVEVIRRCEQVSYILFCQDCREGVTTADGLKAHVGKNHILISKCCKSVVDIFSSLVTDQACGECHQFIYSGLPLLKLCIHTDCPLQGPVFTSRAHSLREFFLRCGITDINVATEDNFESASHGSTSVTYITSCTGMTEKGSTVAVGSCVSQNSFAGTKGAHVDVKTKVNTLSSKSCSNTLICNFDKKETRASEVSDFPKKGDILSLNMSLSNPLVNGVTKCISSFTSNHAKKNVKGYASDSEIFKDGTSLKYTSKKSSLVQDSRPGDLCTNKSMYNFKNPKKANLDSYSASCSTASASGVKATCSCMKNSLRNKSYDCLSSESDSSVTLSDEVFSNISCFAFDEECESGGSSDSSSGSSDGSYYSLDSVRNSDDQIMKENLHNIISEDENGISGAVICSQSDCLGFENSNKINLGDESRLYEREAGGTIEECKHEQSPFNCLGSSFDVSVSRYEIQDTLTPFSFSKPLSYPSYIYRKKMDAKCDNLLSSSELSACCSSLTGISNDRKCGKWAEKSVQVESEYKPVKVDRQTSYSVGLDSSSCTFHGSVSRKSLSLVESSNSQELYQVIKPALNTNVFVEKIAAEKNAKVKATNSNPRLKRSCANDQETGTIKKARTAPSTAKSRKNVQRNEALKDHSSLYVINSPARDLTKNDSGCRASKLEKCHDGRLPDLTCEDVQKPNAFRLRDKESNEDCCWSYEAEESGYILIDEPFRGTQNSLPSSVPYSSINYPEYKESEFPTRQISDNEHFNKTDRFIISDHKTPFPVNEKSIELPSAKASSELLGNAAQDLNHESKKGSAHGDEQSQLNELGWRTAEVDLDVNEIKDRFVIVRTSQASEESCCVSADECDKLKESYNSKFLKAVDQNHSCPEAAIIISDSDDESCYIVVNHEEEKVANLDNSTNFAGTLQQVQSTHDLFNKEKVMSAAEDGSSAFAENQTEERNAEHLNLDIYPPFTLDTSVQPWDRFCLATSVVPTICNDNESFSLAASCNVDKTVVAMNEEICRQFSGELTLPLVKKRAAKKLRRAAKKKRKKKIRYAPVHDLFKGNESCINKRMIKSAATEDKDDHDMMLKTDNEIETSASCHPAQNNIIYLPQLAASSLKLCLDGPACSSSLKSRLQRPQSVTAIPKSVKFKKLTSPRINHLATMERIIFADLENFMILKYCEGQLPPFSYVWGFISARPNCPFHLEDYFCKFPLYKSLKASGCVHISTEIGTSKDAVDFAMTLAIAKLDDRLPSNIPFFIVSKDKGFLEVENQMSASHRLVKVIAPTSHISFSTDLLTDC